MEIFMHALKINVNTIAALQAHLLQFRKGWVKNRLAGAPYDQISMKPKFAAIVPNFSNNEIKLKGSFTYGESGFTFQLTTNPGGKQKPTLNFTTHAKCCASQDLIYSIIEKLVLTALKKIIGREDIIHGNFIEPTLRAYKKSEKINQANRDKITHFEQTGFFDSAFKTFLLQHETDGLRCCKKSKK
jgi:hypothetical protein